MLIDGEWMENSWLIMVYGGGIKTESVHHGLFMVADVR